MLEAIWSPGLRLQPFLVDVSAIDHALAICAIVDADQRILNLLQKGRVGIGLYELLALLLIVAGFIAPITGSRSRHTSAFRRFLYSREQRVFFRKQPLFV